MQIRWSPNSEIAQKLREIFSNSYIYLFSEKQKLTNKKKQLSASEEMREYLAIYSTVFDDVFVIECITYSEIVETKQEIRQNYWRSYNTTSIHATNPVFNKEMKLFHYPNRLSEEFAFMIAKFMAANHYVIKRLAGMKMNFSRF